MRYTFVIKIYALSNVMNQNILSIGRPLVRNYQDYAFPSAAMYNDDGFTNWIYSNTIQLYYDRERQKSSFTYFYNGISPNPLSQIPLLKRQYIKSDTIKKLNIRIIDYIKFLIDDSYYFTTSVNEYYVPNRLTYKKRNFNHGIMVYGYDLQSKTLYTAGYDKNMEFGLQQISFDMFELAFLNTGRNIGCQSFKRNNSNYNFDIHLVKNLLIDYIKSKNTSESLRILQNPIKNCIFGIESYKCIMNHDKYLDTRMFYTVYEHKVLMYKRIEKLNTELNIVEIWKIYDSYGRIVNKARILLMLCLKYNENQKNKILIDIEGRLNALIEEEKDLLTDLISYL